MNKFFLLTAVVLSFILCGDAYATIWSFNNEAQFSGYSGATTFEGFDTIPIDSSIYHTRLPGFIPALDTDDDPVNPDDGPDYDLDGHVNFSTGEFTTGQWRYFSFVSEISFL